MNPRMLILAGFLVAKFFLHYMLIGPEYELHRDEYLHLDQAAHPAWGYLSVPPLTSWISGIIRMLGNTVFWIKFFPGLFGALTMLTVWKTIEELKGDLYALILGAVCTLFSVLLRVNILYQPNSFDILSWTVFYYILVRYLGSQKPGWLFAAAAVLALGFLNKYNVVFQLMGLIPAILLTRHRALFGTKPVYLAGLLALAIVSPNLWWQYRNGFPVIHHLRELAETQLVNVDPFDFLKAQLFFFIGSVPVIAAGFVGLLVYSPFKKYRVFLWSFLFTLGLFLYFSAKDYYAIGLYPVYIAFGAVAFSDFSRERWKKVLRPAVLICPVLFFIPMYRLAFPNKSPEHIAANPGDYKPLGLLRWEDGKDHELPQDFADMLGWKELASKVDRIYSQMPDQESTLVLCDNYGQAGAINYYTGEGIRAVSFNADYIDWFVLDKPYKNLIRVKGRRGKAEELKITAPFFETAAAADSVTNGYARELGTVIFRFTGAKADINARIKDEIREVKGRWE